MCAKVLTAAFSYAKNYTRFVAIYYAVFYFKACTTLCNVCSERDSSRAVSRTPAAMRRVMRMLMEEALKPRFFQCANIYYLHFATYRCLFLVAIMLLPCELVRRECLRACCLIARRIIFRPDHVLAHNTRAVSHAYTHRRFACDTDSSSLYSLV